MVDIPAWELLQILLRVGDPAGVLPDVTELVPLLLLVTKLASVLLLVVGLLLLLAWLGLVCTALAALGHRARVVMLTPEL